MSEQLHIIKDLKRGDKVQDDKGIYTILDSTDSKGYANNKPGDGWELVTDGITKSWKPVHNGMYKKVL